MRFLWPNHRYPLAVCHSHGEDAVSRLAQASGMGSTRPDPIKHQQPKPVHRYRLAVGVIKLRWYIGLACPDSMPDACASRLTAARRLRLSANGGPTLALVG